MQYTEKLFPMIPPLLEWYRENKRRLPWRDDPTPYHVWISEIMLQQTRIEAVIPYYHRFLSEIPDIKTLSEIDDDKLMKLWEGLGYYSRARNLKKAAVQIMAEYDGKLLEEASSLQKLSGIGEYTAGAIASISFGKPEPAVDGNVLRVITRLLGCFDDVMLPATKKMITTELRAVYPTGEDAKNLTQAIMELGEAVCIPNGEAKCDRCPLSEHCAARKENLIDMLPVKTPKKARKIENRTVLLLSCRGKYAIRRRPEKGLLAGLWEYPNTEGHLSEEDIASFSKANQLCPLSIRPIGDAVHIFTHVEWHMIGFAAECIEESSAFEWHTAEEIKGHFAIPTAFRAFTKQLE